MKKTYICGCVRNCYQYLSNIFKNIEKIGELFDEYIIIISFDSSSDLSLDFLKEKENILKNFYLLVNENPLTDSRTINISNARNSILNKIIELNNIDYDYFIMLDCDDVCSGFLNIDVLNKYLNRNDWDSLSFNRQFYYDMWALSYDPYIYSCWHWTPHCHDYIYKSRIELIQKFNNMNDDELFECYSAFNGFAIYRKNKFINCSYSAKINDVLEYIPKNILNKNIELFNINPDYKADDCEHRKFHLEAIYKNNAKIKISKLFLFE